MNDVSIKNIEVNKKWSITSVYNKQIINNKRPLQTLERAHCLKQPSLDITHMKSSEGEIVELRDIISTSKARGQVEKWLLELEADMLASLQKVTDESRQDYESCVRIEWVTKWPGELNL